MQIANGHAGPSNFAAHLSLVLKMYAAGPGLHDAILCASAALEVLAEQKAFLAECAESAHLGIQVPRRLREALVISREALLSRMRKAGARLDDAALCADVAMNDMRAERDRLIVSLRASGVSYRKIAQVFDLDHAMVIRVVTQDAKQSPPLAPTLSP